MEIHIRLAGEEIGPFSETQVRQYMGEGLVSPSDLAIHDGMKDWQSVEELLASLPPPVYSTPVFSDPAPLTEDVPNLPARAAASPSTEAAAPVNVSDTSKPRSDSQPLSPFEQLKPPKKAKTGRTTLTIEPLRSTLSLPPIAGFVAKEKFATKPLSRPGQLALRDIPGKIEARPASPPSLPAAAPSVARPTLPSVTPSTPPVRAPSLPVADEAPSSFQPPPLVKPARREAPLSPAGESEEPVDEETWFPFLFRAVVYTCCGVALGFMGLVLYAFYLFTSHPKEASVALPLPPSQVGKPVVDAGPVTSEDFSARGLKRKEAGDISGALADYDQALQLDPKNIQASYWRGVARQLKGDLNGALDDYNTVIGADLKNADAFSNRAFIKQTLGDMDGALADYHESVILNPKNAIAFYNVGLIKVKQGDLDGAITAYNYALDLDPKMAIAYYNRGNAKNTEGNLDGAIADYTQALVLDPKIALAYCNRGFARQTKGDNEGALADYDAALALNPKMEIVYYNRGLIRVQQGDLNGAIDDSTRAIDLNSKDGPAYCNRGLARMGKSNLDGALADLRKFCELSPRDTGTDSARLYLWLIATQQNPRGTADQDLASALQNDWNSPPEEFSSKIAAFLLGHIREDDLIANAASPDLSREPAQYCKAWYFAGMKRLLAGDRKTAISYFQKCVATNQKDYCEHLFARTELATLGQSSQPAPEISNSQ
jgi:lipoprotein NlpI